MICFRTVFQNAIVIAVLLVCGCGKRQDAIPEHSDNAEKYDNSRIVSLAPSLTETLFALELGANVVGVSKFCKYPPEAVKLPKVGGFIDTDFEAIVQLRPSCVVITRTEADTARRLRSLEIPVLEVPIASFDEIVDSFLLLGRALGRTSQAENVKRAFLDNMHTGRRADAPMTAVVVIWRDYGNGQVRDVQVASRSSIYGRLAEAAGLRLLPDTAVQYPSLSPEMLLRQQPDCIFELLPDCKNVDAAKEDWKKTLPELNAVKNGRIHVIADDYAVVPGPRFTRLCQDFCNAR